MKPASLSWLGVVAWAVAGGLLAFGVIRYAMWVWRAW